ncbi:hypothetical protein UlMin_005902 [Ulmus minor]
MTEKCLIATTLAILVCHPSSTIRCFKPKPKPISSSKSNKIPKKPEEKPTPNSNLVSELIRENSLFGYMENIIRNGWLEKTSLNINRILKVKQSVRTLIKFEQYREMVELEAESATCHLVFHGANITCSLGENGNGSPRICGMKQCRVCRILVSKFSVEDRSMSFFRSVWKAHEKLINNCLFANENCEKRAIIVCRVIVGGFDSILGPTGDRSNGAEELVVLDPRAVLPCFVVIYSV